MENKDIRWLQRFQNFEKSLSYLQEAMEIKKPDIFQKAGTIQFFEMTFELAWNLVKDYLEDQGFQDVKSPRSALKKAFETGLIVDGHKWMELLLNRNLTAHTYDEETADEVIKLIQTEYKPLLKQLYDAFKQKRNG